MNVFQRENLVLEVMTSVMTSVDQFGFFRAYRYWIVEDEQNIGPHDDRAGF